MLAVSTDVRFARRLSAGIAYQLNVQPSQVGSVADMGNAQSDVRISGKGQSGEGLRNKRSLRRLWIEGATEWLREIAELRELEMLVISGTSSSDLAPISQLVSLRRLLVREATQLASLEFVSTLGGLQVLSVTNSSKVRDLEPVGHLTRLTAFAIEISAAGADRGMDVAVDTLKPLAALSALEYLYLVSLKVADESLEPLVGLKSLKVLECGAFFPKDQFKKLKTANPQLICQWLDVIDTPLYVKLYQGRSRKASRRH
jgi:Leucine-rich repeat (LRR) protein